MRVAASLLVLASLAPAAIADSSATPPRLPGKVALQQKLDAQIPLDLMFRDEAGRVVRLSKFFGRKPVILSFMYYRCPMLCSMVQEAMTSALTEVKFDIGNEYDVITVSIDPRDTPEAAAEKKEHYIKRYGRLASAPGWHFLTAHESAIKSLTSAVGFEYAYDPAIDQFAHGAVLIVLTPGGRVSRYLPGIDFRPRDIRLALTEASQGKVGSLSDQLLLLCYHYDPSTGKYAKSVMTLVRAGGVATMLGLAGFIFVMIRGERKAGRTNPEPDETIAK
ncbi:MAG: electron transport protein SCO1/SenC [Acidobacteria bacterium]|nr:electron transport protein SCO1/SenC [Acidobacteriota bacterium]